MTEQAHQDVETALVNMMAELNELEGGERRASLIEWARSDWWSPVLMLCEGSQGEVAREAYRILKHELDADTPARQWAKSDYSAGRATIHRLLCPVESGHAFYACLPFKTFWTQEDEPWIAAAVGCEPLIDLDRRRRWEHIDISAVILWDPRRNVARLLGDDNGRDLIAPYCSSPGIPVQVYDDPLLFFRAWAADRLTTWSLWKQKQNGEWVHPVTEPRDGGLPGILALGGVDRQRWTSVDADRLIAPQGADPRLLRRAVIASANLPRVEEAGRANG